MKKDFKLCYIEGNFAYFTTQKLNEQWGDDWNDRPYEHNAGEPYEPFKDKLCYNEKTKTHDIHESDYTDGKPNWEIKKVCFFADGVLQEPQEVFYNGGNSPFCVEDINAKKVPWLQTSSYEEKNVKIWAGCSIEEFKKLVRKAGGKIYVEEK